MSKEEFNQDAERLNGGVRGGLAQLMSAMETIAEQEQEAMRQYRRQVERAYGEANKVYSEIIPKVTEQYHDFLDKISDLSEGEQQPAKATAEILGNSIDQIDNEWQRIQKVMKDRYYVSGEAMSIIGRLERVEKELKHINETYVSSSPQDTAKPKVANKAQSTNTTQRQM